MTAGPFPFGMTGYFNELVIKDGDRVTLHYVPNPKQWIAHNCCADEVFYGGAVGGGKTTFIRMHVAAHCLAYGRKANTVIFRRTYDQLEGAVIPKFLADFEGKAGHYIATQRKFAWGNGAITWFRHLEEWNDVEKHQGRAYTLIDFDELTHFEERMYDRLRIWLRADEPGVQCQTISGSNPRGIGHHWVYRRFVKDREPNRVYVHVEPAHMIGALAVPERRVSRIFVPAKIGDNPHLLRANPDYVTHLRLSCSPEEFQAFAEGDWTIFEGRAFPDWMEELHVVPDFDIPKDWKVIRSLDWGYSSPFSVGWWAQDPESRRIYRIDEWYGAITTPGGAERPLNLAIQDVRQGILDRERGNVTARHYPEPWYGVADPSIWSKTGTGTSIGFELNRPWPLFRAADAGPGSRATGKQLFHSLLRPQPETGKPGVQVFESCMAFRRSVPTLALDEREGQERDVDKRQPDHLYDDARYGLTDLVGTTAVRRTWEDREADRKAARMPVLI